MTGLSFTIDAEAISLIAESRPPRVLGTVFAFIRPNWVVTARHVVEDQGLIRENLVVLVKNTWVSARVLYAHPQVDIAVLQTSIATCDIPLFPAHHKFAGSTGLVVAGYMPSKTDSRNVLAVEVNHIPNFEIEPRGRADLEEETICFRAPFAEGGNSGGPVFGAGGGVIGLVIQRYGDAEAMFTRATSISPILSRLTFANEE
jgi:S1-C subfamily serine protease